MRGSAFIVSMALSVAVCSPFLAAQAQEVRKQQGIAYVTGGIGVNERTALRAMQDDFSVKLRFAVKEGAYLANVNVEIQDAQGKSVLEGTSDGPWFMVNLKPGTYTVLASDANEKIRRQVQIQPESFEEVLFSFKDR